MSFKSVAIIGRQNSSSSVKTLSTLIEHLKTKKVAVYLEQDTASMLSNSAVPTISRENLKNHCDLIVVVGGDGSLLSAARIAATQQLPIVGINRGDLGFLTDVAPYNISKIDDILSGNYLQEDRLLLTASIIDQEKIIVSNVALNDVVLLSYTPGHIIEFAVHVDEQFLCNYRADGVIVATPTGSTAHALSSGGPILHPTLENIVLVPMQSHNLSSRPIVLKSESEIAITFNQKNIMDLLVVCDGQIQTTVHGGAVKIKKTTEKLQLLHPIDYNYFETLRTKLNWEKDYKKI